MPRLPIDYNNCIIYKIVCNDVNVTDTYVGHTTQFRERKSKHKYICNNKNSDKYNYKVYDFIREHGGFGNWDMVLVEKHPCNDSQEACKRERFWIETLNSTLNSCIPFRTQTEKEEYPKEYGKQNAAKIREYVIDNADKIKEYQKEYYQNNIEKTKEYNKDYQAINSAKLKEKDKEYYQANSAKLKAKTDCECSGHYQHQHKAKHLKTKLHMSYCSQIN